MSTLELLKRLEGKGVPVKTENYTSAVDIEMVVLYTNRHHVFNTEPENFEEELRNDPWLIIGCVVEYMEAQGFNFYCEARVEKSQQVIFVREGEPGQAAIRPTLLEAVLLAADRALP